MIHTYTCQNQRPYQEDVAVIKLKYSKVDITATETENFGRHNVDLLMVCDGHGGGDISKEVANMLPAYFYKNAMIDDNLPKPTQKYNDYILATFDKVHNELNAKHSKSTAQGTTVCMCLIYEFKNKKFITSIWAGDSRAVACDQYLMARALSLDHKPDAPKEYYRIIKAGGKVETEAGGIPRVNGVLAVARSIGDFDNKIGVEHKPDILHMHCEHKFIVLASDGLWDVMNNQQVVDFVVMEMFRQANRAETETFQIQNKTKKDKTNIANMLADEAIRLGSDDNITIIIYFMDTMKEDWMKYM